MKAYRYNARNRKDRKFNNCGSEKNPLNVKFYATNLEYAEAYRFVHFEDGSVNYECELETTDVAIENLFDMCAGFQNTKSFKTYINEKIGQQMSDYTEFLNNAKTKKDIELWDKEIANLKNRKSELIDMLKSNEFQGLSDFHYQNILVEELKSLGYKGYLTTNEIALF